MYYESDSEIEKLVEWLRADIPTERKLRKAINKLLKNIKSGIEYTEKHVLGRDASESSTLPRGSTSSSSGRTVTKALLALGEKMGPLERCGCLETLKRHCQHCHVDLSTRMERRRHMRGICQGGSSAIGEEGDPKQKRLKSMAYHETSLRIGPKVPIIAWSKSKLEINEPAAADKDKPSSSVKGNDGPSKSSIVPESSLRSLGGRASNWLRNLRMDLLDIEAALLQDALRTSRRDGERKRAWRDFVKSAKSIYEMVQAILVLEDMIKSEYLRPDWRFWSSPSTAATIATLSALALRIDALDSAVSYDQPFR